MTTKKSKLVLAVFAIATSFVALAQERPTTVRVADAVEVTATVESVDLAQRLVTVSGPWKDRLVTVRVGSEIPDLDKLKVGDRVEVIHNAAVVGEIKKAGTAARAAKDGPSAESGNRTVVVVIDSVDAAENTVSFMRDGKMRTAVVESPAAQAFIKTLNPSAGYATTNFVTVDMTSIPQTWGTYSVLLPIDAGLVGQLLQIGFTNTATYYTGSGVFYDNINFQPDAPTPLKSVSWGGIKSLYR